MNAINEFLEELIRLGGSDLHMSANKVPMIRVDGEIQQSKFPVQSHQEIESLLHAIMDERAMKEFSELSDCDFAYEIEGLARFRVNVFEDRFGMGTVMRQIPSEVLTADQLNLPESIRELCHLSKGLVVVTGPTGSGKSTTLAAMIDLINKSRPDHIITIEDPIEFVHQDQKCLVNQRQIKDHTTSFSHALRAALRQDPDIVMVGEMRDLETIEIAIETAETGHLVFGTLHTTTAASTMDRIIDAFPANRQNQIRSMLSTSLKAVIAQTLCKKISGGRVAALEILKVDHGISALIRDGKIHQIPSAMQTGGSKGMKLLNTSLADLVANGTIAPEEAYLKAIDKELLIRTLKKLGAPLPAFDEHDPDMAPPDTGTGGNGGGGAPPPADPAPTTLKSMDGKKKRGIFG